VRNVKVRRNMEAGGLAVRLPQRLAGAAFRFRC
jgi:hypothetical protein